MANSLNDPIDRQIKSLLFKKYKSQFTSEGQAKDLFWKVRTGKYVSSLASLAADVDGVIEFARDRFIEKNYCTLKSILDEEVQYNFDNIDIMLSREHVGFTKLLHDRAIRRMTTECPIQSSSVPSSWKSSKGISRDILIKRFDWYNLDATKLHTAEHEQLNSIKLARYEEILEEHVPTYFSEEPNYYTHNNALKEEFNLSNLTVPFEAYTNRINKLSDPVTGKSIARGLVKNIIKKYSNQIKKNNHKVKQIVIEKLNSSTYKSEFYEEILPAVQTATGYKGYIRPGAWLGKIVKVDNYIKTLDDRLIHNSKLLVTEKRDGICLKNKYK